MSSFFHKFKIIIPILFISVLYNLLWFSAFIYVLFQYPDFRVSLTLSFLFFYTMLALPVKDWFTHLIFFSHLYPDTGNILVQDKRIKDLTNKSEIGNLMRILLRELNIAGLVMVTNRKPLVQSSYYRDPEKTHVAVSPGDVDSMLQYFQQGARRSLAGPIPDELKGIVQNYDWGAIVPVYYKSRYFGFIAVAGGIDVKKIGILEALAGRIGLILENEILTESAIKNESFKKEFNLARQIERFLLVHEVVEVAGYRVFTDKKLLAGAGGSFPVLFEKSVVESPGGSPYFIYCRISRSNPRMRTMMLFMIAGYFLTHSKSAKSLQELFKTLNESLFLNGPEFSIDGFLVHKLSGSHWRLNYFGKNVQVVCDGHEVDLKVGVSPLGSHRGSHRGTHEGSRGVTRSGSIRGGNPEGVYEYVDLKNKDEIILAINRVEGVRILKK